MLQIKQKQAERLQAQTVAEEQLYAAKRRDALHLAAKMGAAGLREQGAVVGPFDAGPDHAAAHRKAEDGTRMVAEHRAKMAKSKFERAEEAFMADARKLARLKAAAHARTAHPGPYDSHPEAAAAHHARERGYAAHADAGLMARKAAAARQARLLFDARVKLAHHVHGKPANPVICDSDSDSDDEDIIEDDDFGDGFEDDGIDAVLREERDAVAQFEHDRHNRLLAEQEAALARQRSDEKAYELVQAKEKLARLQRLEAKQLGLDGPGWDQVRSIR
eukprot:SAG31_NODE_1046_length_10177_cov_13.677218_2_plen_276_part_00